MEWKNGNMGIRKAHKHRLSTREKLLNWENGMGSAKRWRVSAAAMMEEACVRREENAERERGEGGLRMGSGKIETTDEIKNIISKKCITSYHLDRA